MSEPIPPNATALGQNLYYESEGTSHIDFQNIKAASDTIKVISHFSQIYVFQIILIYKNRFIIEKSKVGI